MFVVIGDTHGNYKYIRGIIENRDIRDTTFLHVGDFGVGFAPEGVDRAEINKINTILEARNCQMYVIRGNHDKPYCFDGTWKWTNIELVPDYTVVTVNGDDILMVGGAVSIDRAGRKKDMLRYAAQGNDRELYWFDEDFVLDEEKLKEVAGVRYVVTHTCPHFAEPVNNIGIPTHGWFVEGFCAEDPKLKEDLNKERDDMTKMYEILKEKNLIEKWFYGHFHKAYAAYYEDTDFVLLDINEFKEIRQGDEV